MSITKVFQNQLFGSLFWIIYSSYSVVEEVYSEQVIPLIKYHTLIIAFFPIPYLELGIWDDPSRLSAVLGIKKTQGHVLQINRPEIQELIVKCEQAHYRGVITINFFTITPGVFVVYCRHKQSTVGFLQRFHHYFGNVFTTREPMYCS